VIAEALAAWRTPDLIARLEAAEIAFARVNDMAALSKHPQLNRLQLETPAGPLAYPAPPGRRSAYDPVPALGEHTDAVRREFAGAARASTPA
jgi:formyl-CoA transferase